MYDWRYPIDSIRDEVRKLRSDGRDSMSLNEIEKLLDGLNSIHERLDEKLIRDGVDDNSVLQKFIQDQKEVITNTYEHAQRYSNIIIFGGYAGLFTIWNFTKDTLSNWQILFVGLFTLVSLLIYIVFELYGFWLRTTQVNNQMKELIEAEQLDKFPKEYGKAELDRAKKLMIIWPYFFLATVIFALIASSILIYSFISTLICNYS